MVAAAADISLVVDAKGVIQDLALGGEDFPGDVRGIWVGRHWMDTVTVDSRDKVQELLREAGAAAEPRRRHVNHQLAGGSELPVLYSAIRLDPKGRVLALGRDLRAVSAIQQRLVEAQQSLDRDYWRIRQVETRYRLLFDLSSEAILMVDASTHLVVEANPAATKLLGAPQRKLAGQPFPVGVDARTARAVDAMLAQLRASGRADPVLMRAARGRAELTVSASLVKQEDGQFFLVRFSGQPGEGATSSASPSALITQVIERAPDGLVVTDLEGRVLIANPAFVDLVQLAGAELVRGQSLDRWLGRPGVDLSVLLATLRQHGSVKLFATTMRGELGANADVEISAVAVPDATPPCLGFTVRHVGRRIATAGDGPRTAPRSVEQLTQLVGRMPLKDLVRESTDLIEQLCIEAALELTQDNRASAAGLLGLSRQSFYVKLRRHGLGHRGEETA